TFVRPGRDDARKVVLARAIGIYICLNFLAVRARFFYQGEQLGHTAPERVIGDLDMYDVYRDAGPPADLDGLRRRLEDAVSFVPHVRGVDTSIMRRYLAHRYQ